MRRPVTFAALVLTAAVAYGIYQLKYDVARLETELARLDRDLIAERETIRVLRAEWSYLNRPERLSKLAAHHLDLGPVANYPRADLERLPLKPRGRAGPSRVAAPTPPLPVPRPPLRTRDNGAVLASARPAP